MCPVSWPPTIGELLLPRAQDAHGVFRKLHAYSLNPAHQVGAHKAKVFRQALAITLADTDYLAEHLLAGIRETPISAVREHDVVRLLEPLRNWPAGTVGTVVGDHGAVLLLEIANERGETLDFVQVPIAQLELKR